MSKAAWIIFGSVIVLVLGGLVLYSRFSNPAVNVSSIDANAIIAASADNGQIADHTFGKTDSKVVLVEYGDFQCPSCGGAHPQIKAVTEEYKDKILFIFRNLPLRSIHPNALAGAAAVEAAGLQGKYWEMHNQLFENQSSWTSLSATERTNVFADYATQLGLDRAKFISDLSAKSVAAKIDFDQAIFKKTGFATATPTFVLNGKQVDSATSSSIVQGNSDKLKALLDKTLEQNK